MKNAFTLIELLVVILILSFIISVVAPAGYNMYNSFTKYLNKRKKIEKENDLRYKSFIFQQENQDNNISFLGAKK